MKTKHKWAAALILLTNVIYGGVLPIFTRFGYVPGVLFVINSIFLFCYVAWKTITAFDDDI